MFTEINGPLVVLDQNPIHTNKRYTYHFNNFDELECKLDVNGSREVMPRQKVDAVIALIKKPFVKSLFGTESCITCRNT